MCFIVGSILSQPFKKLIDRKLIIMIGTLFCATGAVLIGPSEHLGIPQKLGIITTGCAFLGIGAACVFPNALPEICFQVNKVFKLNKEFNNNFAAGIFRLMQGFGQITGPLLGTFITEKYKFSSMTDVLALAWIGYGILYFIFGGGIDAIKNPPGSKNTTTRSSSINNSTNAFNNKEGLVGISDYIKKGEHTTPG